MKRMTKHLPRRVVEDQEKPAKLEVKYHHLFTAPPQGSPYPLEWGGIEESFTFTKVSLPLNSSSEIHSCGVVV